MKHETVNPATAALIDLPDPAADLVRHAETTHDLLDQLIWRSLATLTRGASPLAFATAWFDYLSHLSIAPGQRRQMAVEAGGRLAAGWRSVADAVLPEKGDGLDPTRPLPAERCARALVEAYDEWANWLTSTCASARGVSRENADRVAFSLRQALEAAHPRNNFWTNPDALRAAREERGANLVRGWANFLEDVANGDFGMRRGADASAEVGKRLAATPGRVVYRNRLIELIQYDPVTPRAHAEPVLIVPAWIMKYYILDLSPGHSLIGWLLEQGFTVFTISWRNPDREDRDLGFDDYRRLGVLAALDAVSELADAARVHALGYCLGGTLLSVTAAGLARDGDTRIATLTLLAAQTDFSDAGELSLFIDDAQLAALEAGMDAAGYLEGEQMAGAFSMLRARDLLWRRMQEAYFLGRRGEMIDLMIWNGDTTRMPYRMHSEYLRQFFLDNDFANGRLRVDGRPVAISDIRAPVFALGTTKDHVAPWRSVFKIHLSADTEITFALTNGGHNAGVVSPPGHPRRHHHILTRADADHYLDPDTWLEMAEAVDGSWWPSWTGWLARHSSGEVAARTPRRADGADNLLAPDAPLPPAPGPRHLRLRLSSATCGHRLTPASGHLRRAGAARARGASIFRHPCFHCLQKYSTDTC